MDIRVNQKNYDKLIKLWEKSPLNKEVVTFNLDKNVEAMIMVKNAEGAYVQWFSGYDKIESFIRLGYVSIQKRCPLLKKKCIGYKCSLFVIKNSVGDCAHVWSALKL